MKKTWLSILALAVIFISASAFHFAEKDDQKKGQKKMHIKMVKNMDGQVVKLDTILVNFSDDDPDKIKALFLGDDEGDLDSLMQTMTIRIDTEGDSLMRRNVKVFAHGMSMDDMNIEEMDEGDSLVHTFCITAHGDGRGKDKNVMIWKGKKGEEPDHFGFVTPPVTPTPPVPPFGHVKVPMHSKNVIHLDDPSIISYKRKDLGGNKEKIEIIREKPENN